MATLSDIQSFLSQKRIAIAGVSRKPKDFSRSLFDEFVRRGYEIVPVNPSATEIGGKQCFRSIGEVIPAPEGVLVLTGKGQTERIIQDCKAAGIPSVWTYGTSGRKSLSTEFVDGCKASGMTIIEGECPFMFLEKSGGIHKLHGFLLKMFGSYPA